MKKESIYIIGAAILDVLVVPAEPEVFASGSSPADDIRISFGGDAFNEATILSALGKKVTLNTVIGTDSEGDMIRQRCERKGICLVEGSREKLQTGVNVVLVRRNGERNFLTNRNGSLRKLTLEDVRMPFPEDTQILCFASIFVFPGMGEAEMAAVFAQAKSQGITVCADMTKRKHNETVSDIAKALQYVDYLMPNEEEAYLVTGAETPEQAADILQRAGAKNVIIKCGKRGCYVLPELKGPALGICSRENMDGFYVPAVAGVTCVDTTGAGDSFAAGFVYGLSEGWDLRRCAVFANNCGAQAVAAVGATKWCDQNNEKTQQNQEFAAFNKCPNIIIA